MIFVAIVVIDVRLETVVNIVDDILILLLLCCNNAIAQVEANEVVNIAPLIIEHIFAFSSSLNLFESK